MGYYHSCEKQIDNGSVLPRRKDCKYQKVLHQNVVLYLKIAHRCSEYYEALTGVTAFFIPKFNYFNGFFTVNASMSSF